MQTTPHTPPRHLTGRAVLLCMLGFFTVVAGVNAVMMTAAIRTMPGLEVKNSYVASQHYNADIAAMRAQTARGWATQLQVRLAQGTARVGVDMADAGSTPLTGLAVTARLAHPVDRNADREVALTETAPGHYTASLAGIHAGAWDVVLEAGRGEAVAFRSRNRVHLAE
jgi:nitrogen fixation protein FixH